MRPARLLLSLLLLIALPVLAHHGWSSYDANKAMRFDAALAEVKYRNPHAEVGVDHGGKRWNVVLAPLSRLASRGLPEAALTEGKTITIEGYPRLDGTPELRAERVVVDGKTIELR
ncbi:DUF6152 family protein [Pseudoxanthomonas composti]|uniref:Uncharacterized protein n=1 Tax=Pseudoxanthomonas composti TaxID=2137479 RepID=A0A4Q1JWZ6_9GAMM|nr:DUF6152 family protein [Pseudoxanthomonas composti]RXR07164.1 hypothetical protein EPA99_04385 [Pseudoxanthomonas composti]